MTEKTAGAGQQHACSHGSIGVKSRCAIYSARVGVRIQLDLCPCKPGAVDPRRADMLERGVRSAPDGEIGRLDRADAHVVVVHEYALEISARLVFLAGVRMPLRALCLIRAGAGGSGGVVARDAGLVSGAAAVEGAHRD